LIARPATGPRDPSGIHDILGVREKTFTGGILPFLFVEGGGGWISATPRGRTRTQPGGQGLRNPRPAGAASSGGGGLRGGVRKTSGGLSKTWNRSRGAEDHRGSIAPRWGKVGPARSRGSGAEQGPGIRVIAEKTLVDGAAGPSRRLFEFLIAEGLEVGGLGTEAFGAGEGRAGLPDEGDGRPAPAWRSFSWRRESSRRAERNCWRSS
jgi:hypothetical protein